MSRRRRICCLAERRTLNRQRPYRCAKQASQLFESGTSQSILSLGHVIYQNIHCRMAKKIATPPAQKIGLL
jgi:hypothetical protein